MKQAKNSEIDLLLRKLARQEPTDSTKGSRAVNAAPDHESGKHLDTDELNAYAENALPSNARMLYTEHLADCARCRKLVAELSLASASIIRHPPVEIGAPSSLRKYLSSFFSPAVLRYVVPAFVVIAVAAVALVILRQKPNAEFVAQNQSSTSSSVTPEGRETKASVKDASLKKGPPAAVEPTANSKTSNPLVEQARPSAKASDKAATDDLRRESKKAPIDESSSGVAAEQAAEAPPPAPTVAAKPQAAVEIQTEREMARQKKLADQGGGNKEEDRDQRVDSGAASRMSSPKAGTFGVVANIRGADSKDAPAAAGTEKSAKSGGEVRNVVGHRFRKQGNVWVDSAYDSSRQTMNLSRGSEQYRALVADEPAIRTIAEQLDGEVIVVWKGRVYRIR
jgi:hypothetical protein